MKTLSGARETSRGSAKRTGDEGRERGGAEAGRPALRRTFEYALILGSAVLGYVFFSSMDLAERFLVFAERYERWQMDELLGAVLFAALATGAVLLRRNRRERAYLRRIEESERRFATIFHGAADALLVSDPTGRILDVNEEAARALDYAREDLLGSSLSGAEVCLSPEKDPEAWERLLAGERVVVRGVNRRADGTEFRAEASAALVELEGRPVVVATVRDVTEREETLEALRVSRERGEAILRAVPDAVCRITLGGVFLDVRAGEKRKLLRPRKELIGNNLRNVLGEEIAERFLAKVREAAITGEIQSLEYPISFRDEERMIEARIVYVGGDEAIYFARDITERYRMLARLGESEARSRAIVESIPDLVFRFDREGRYLDLAPGQDPRVCAPGESVVGRTVGELMPEGVAGRFLGAISAALDTGELRELEFELDLGGGVKSWEGRFVRCGEGEVVCLVRDIDERKEFERRIRHLAYFDELTGLPNRTGFVERLEAAMEDPAREVRVVLLVDLQDFAKINGSLGREAGDRLLALFAASEEQYLQESSGGRSELARFGSNEFAAFFDGVDLPEVERIVSGAISSYRDLPFHLDELDVFLKVKVGIATVEPGDQGADVLRKVSVALREAKRDRESIYRVYSEPMGQRAVSDIRLERDLRRAIEGGELEVFYQPEVFLKSGSLYSFEALARWDHPTRGRIGPVDFIPLAEETGLIIPLGEYVLFEACRQMGLWNRTYPGLNSCTVSVNVSALQLRQRSFARKVRAALEKNDLSPHQLQIEITESAAAADLEASMRTFARLREIGVKIALDDFGTGYSSLSHLRKLPLDAVKLDRSFVSEVTEESRMYRVVASVVQLAHALDLKVVAEGVETPEQILTLRNLGCDVGQGYHFARPMSGARTLEMISSWRDLDLVPGAG